MYPLSPKHIRDRAAYERNHQDYLIESDRVWNNMTLEKKIQTLAEYLQMLSLDERIFFLKEFKKYHPSVAQGNVR